MDSPALKKILELIPAAVGELTAEFVAQKEFNERAEIKQYMKELLDVVAINTIHPQIPAKQPPPNQRGGDGDIMAPDAVYQPAPRIALRRNMGNVIEGQQRDEPLPPIQDNHIYPVPGVPAN